MRRRVRQLGYLVLHQPAHRRYVHEVESYVDRGMTRDGVFQRYKYLGDYLARSFSARTRRAIIMSHYRFVGAGVIDPAFHAINGDGIELWDQSFDAHRATILLTAAEFAPMEGEWQLQFLLDGDVLCTLSFLFATLPDFAPEGETVCLIGGVQGGYDRRAAIRIAAKANREIAPTTMLILAVKAIAQALRVGTVFGVSSQQQIVQLYAADRMSADYDEIWASEGAVHRIEGFYDLSHGLIERALSDIPLSHRRRTKLKRNRKAEILDEMTATARKALLGQRPPTAA